MNNPSFDNIGNPTRSKWYAVIVAGGSGSRFGGQLPKQFAMLGNRPVLQWSIDAFFACPGLAEMIVVSHPDWIDESRKLVNQTAFSDRIRIVPGGAVRQDSCRAGLNALPNRDNLPVLIHDAARPWIQPALIQRVLNAVQACECVIPVCPVVDSIVSTENGIVIDYPARSRLGLVQTPQGFRLGTIRDIHRNTSVTGESMATDDGSLALEDGYVVKIVAGQPDNHKITHPSDLNQS